MVRIYLTHTPDLRQNYFGAQALERLRQLGQVRLHESALPPTPEEVIEQAHDCQFIISARVPPIGAQIFSSLPDLLACSRVAVDIRNIDLAAASQAGVLVTRASPGFAVSVSEWVLGVMIDFSRDISRSRIDYRAGRAPRIRMGRQLQGSTIGIIGYGAIGRQLARACTALGMQLIVHDPFVTQLEVPGQQLSLDELLSRSDFVVCLAPVNAQTHHMINAAVFEKMQAHACFINAGRGELVDEGALLQALENGQIAGCALDVGMGHDQTPSLALACHPDVIATPHIAGLTPEAVAHQALESVAQVAELLAGRFPIGSVNAEHARRIKHYWAKNRIQEHTDANT